MVRIEGYGELRLFGIIPLSETPYVYIDHGDDAGMYREDTGEISWPHVRLWREAFWTLSWFGQMLLMTGVVRMTMRKALP